MEKDSNELEEICVPSAKGPWLGWSSCMMQDVGYQWLPDPLGCGLWAPVKGWSRDQHLWAEGLRSRRAGEGAVQRGQAADGGTWDVPRYGFLLFVSSWSNAIHMLVNIASTRVGQALAAEIYRASLPEHSTCSNILRAICWASFELCFFTRASSLVFKPNKKSCESLLKGENF